LSRRKRELVDLAQSRFIFGGDMPNEDMKSLTAAGFRIVLAP
jgi:hypothetical protein